MVNSVKPYSLRASVKFEHGSASLEPDIVLMLLVHHGGITAHIVRLFSFVTLTQVNFFPASLLMHRCVRSRSRSYDSVFPTRHSRFLSRSRGKKKSHKKRKYLPLLVLLTTLPSLLLEKEKGNCTSLKKKHTSLRPFKHD